MNKALIIVDMQNDFIDPLTAPLLVKNGREIIDNIVKAALSGYDLIVATRDFHPRDHCSFKELGGEWPMHCVAGSVGANIDHRIDAVADVIVSKGTDPDKEAYSGFDRTILADVLRGITDVTVVGVATDYCVQATALDAVKLGFNTTVLLDCIAGVAPETSREALIRMTREGVELQFHV